jgi:transcriptional regulator with XRE-family HTH domain
MTRKDEFQKMLGQNIRRLRTRRSMTLEELSLEAGMAYSQVSRIELGKRNPSSYTLFILSTTLNANASELFDFQAKDKQSPETV